MSKIINVELKERLEKIYSEVYELIGSKEFNEEKYKYIDLLSKCWEGKIELSEEEESYCSLFYLENLKEFIRDVDL